MYSKGFEYKFTVYLPSHNYGAFLGDAIESVLRQSVDSWELLLINDGSSDNTQEIMDRYESDDRIKVFSTEGIGLHAVCNLALREAKGEYIVRLDGDDIFDENILLILGNVLDRSPEVGMVYPDFYLMDEVGNTYSREKTLRPYEEHHVDDTPPNGACTLARTEVLREVGGYRDDLGAQDGFYIWTKVKERYKCVNVNLPLFYYRRHQQNLTTTGSKLSNARRQIKRETTLELLEESRPITAVIPCRRNYDYSVDLWKQTLNGVSLLERAIYSCIQSTLLDNVIVACDNEEAREVCEKFSDPRLKFFLRNREDTIRSRGIVPLLEKILKDQDPESKGITLVSYVQSPFVKTDSLEEAVFTLFINDADSSIGVEEIDRPVFRTHPFGLEALNSPNSFTQDSKKIYAESHTVIAARNKNFMTGSLRGAKVTHFQVNNDETFFIDTENKRKIAETMEEIRSKEANSSDLTLLKANDLMRTRSR